MRPNDPRPRKKIVLFSDGTGNSSAKLEKTNVWRLFQSLDQNRCDVLALYDNGVGTAANRYLAAVAGAFGWGLKRNVLDLYTFLCRNWAAGDDIYGFGFSRGAFTIRALVGLIDKEGLVPFRSEEDLARNVKAAYRSYRGKSFTSWSPIVWAMRGLRDLVILVRDGISPHPGYGKVCETRDEAGRRHIPIRFLGLFDTVEAYGLPILELKRGIDWVLWPMMFGDLELSTTVQRACHALALDDERTTFHPLLWDESKEAELVARKKVAAGRITQVWFAGAHSNVGGGYPEDQLAMVALSWMMNQAMAEQLPLLPECVGRANAEKSPFARIHDSREGLKAYYRYEPRRVPEFWDKSRARADGRGRKIRPIVHGSVIMRMHCGSDRYAPITLPRKFWVLAPDGALIQKEGFAERLRADATKRMRAAAPSQVKSNDTLAAEKLELERAITAIDRPEADAVAIVWDTVWWRRLVYFVTVALTSLLAVYPLVAGKPYAVIRWAIGGVPLVGDRFAAALDDAVKRASDSSVGIVKDLFDALAGLIPGYLGPWATAARTHVVEFGFLVAAIFVFLFFGTRLKTRVHDRAYVAWHKETRASYLQWLRESRRGWRNGMGIGFLLSFALTLAAYHRGWEPLTLIVLNLSAAAFLVLFILRLAEAPFGRADEVAADRTPLRGSWALRLARWLRRNRLVGFAYAALFDVVVPLAFGLALVAAVGYGANRLVFDSVSAVGKFCRPSAGPLREVDNAVEVRGFRIETLCWASGARLEEGHRYRITITIVENWFDGSRPADVQGVPAEGIAQRLGAPMRRWWFQNYLKPIARIGALGNDEYVLESRDASHDSPTQRTLVSSITVRTTGELFIYVNDAVEMLPGPWDAWYRNNTGSADVKIEPMAAQ